MDRGTGWQKWTSGVGDLDMKEEKARENSVLWWNLHFLLGVRRSHWRVEEWSVLTIVMFSNQHLCI